MTYGFALEILASALTGAVGWSFMEYAMHNWNGHKMKGKTLFSREHLAHHADSHYFSPNWLKVVMSIPPLVAL